MVTTALALVAAVALAAALFLERVRREQRRTIERASLRVRVESTLAEGLVAGNPIPEVLRALIPGLADWCVLHLVEEGQVHRSAVLHANPEIERHMHDAFSRVPFSAEARRGPASVIRTGKPELDREFTPSMLDGVADPNILRQAGLSSVICVPLRARSDIVGALTLARRVSRAYEQSDLAWARDVAHRVGLTIENRRLYAEARDLFEQTVSANFVSSADGTLVACNRTFATLLGFRSPEEALQIPVTDLYIEPADRDEFLSNLQARGRLGGYELGLRRRDGTIVSALAQAVGQFDDRGRLTRVMGFLEDQTMQKALEERLRHAQRLEALGQLAGGVAHDFDNLLTLIIGCADVMQAISPEEDGALRTPLEELTIAARRAASLTQQLLAFSRRQILQPRLLAPDDVLHKMHDTLRHHVPPRIVLILDLDPYVKPVLADPAQLERVVVNLVTNAVDAISGAGTITIGARPFDAGEVDAVECPQMRPGRYVVLSVEDTGAGMDLATAERVFEPFFTTKPAGTGAGLGLSTVYGIVKQSGGYVWIASVPGAGTLVKVCLPVDDELARLVAVSRLQPSSESMSAPPAHVPEADC